METARVLLEVVAGIVPNQPLPELTKHWAITSDEWAQAELSVGGHGSLLSQRNGQALGYAAWLMMQPDRCNWVRTNWIWL